MATMNLSLPEPMKQFVENQAELNGFSSVSEYLRSVIGELQRQSAKQQLEAKLREGIESGPATDMTRDDWSALRRQVRQRQKSSREP